MHKESYEEEFLNCQQKMKALLLKPPVSVQNWSIQRTLNFKEQIKKNGALIKLKPASKHTDFLKMENGLRQLQEYYN